MIDAVISASDLKEANEAFFVRADASIRKLFEAAKAKNELHFALALMPETRGMQDAGWNTAHETQRAFFEYLEFLENLESSPIKARVSISFYCHLAEASGFYEVPKNMLRIAGGESHLLTPFKNLVKQHSETGKRIAPNANKVLRDLAGHAATLGLDDLASVFADAFDPDVRNGFAHADYVVWDDGLRLPMRNGGQSRVIPWEDWDFLFNRAANFFNLLQELIAEHIQSYNTPKKIRARLNEEPEADWVIFQDADTGAFGIRTGYAEDSDI